MWLQFMKLPQDKNNREKIFRVKERDYMKILFIGGTGTISQAITRALVAKGEEVILVNRGTSTTRTATVAPLFFRTS